MPDSASTSAPSDAAVAAVAPDAPPSPAGPDLHRIVGLARACYARPPYAKKIGKARERFEVARVSHGAGSSWNVSFGHRLSVAIDPVADQCDGKPVSLADDPGPTMASRTFDVVTTLQAAQRCADEAIKNFPGSALRTDRPIFIVADSHVWLEYRDEPPNGLIGPPELDITTGVVPCTWVGRK